VRTTLEAFGYQVLAAAAGAEALALFERNREHVRVVVVDLMMPGMDGLALIRALFRFDPAVRVLAVSATLPPGLGQEPDLQRVPSLHKPYRAQRLLEVLREVLDA